MSNTSSNTSLNPFHINFYKLICNKYSNPDERIKQLRSTIKHLISEIRYFYAQFHNTQIYSYDGYNINNSPIYIPKSEKYELEPYKTPMSYLFWYIKPYIVRLIANISPPDEAIIINRFDYLDIYWNIIIIDKFIELRLYDLIIWWLHIPYFLPSNKIAKSYLNIYTKMLEYLDANSAKIHLNQNEFLFASNETCMPYAISYFYSSISETCNISLILHKYHDLIRKIAPWLVYYSGNIIKPKPKSINNTDISNVPPRKICFISDNLACISSVFRDRASIIGKMNTSGKLQVYIAVYSNILSQDTSHAIQNTTTTPDTNIANTFIRTFKNANKLLILDPNNIDNTRKTIESYDFDILFYCDIGMRVNQTNLAHSRLAPIQVTTFGHSETSGINTIDYYISSKWFGSDQKYFTEKLVLTPRLGMYYIEPCILYGLDIQKFKTQSELGFPSDANIYGCLQNFAKINIDFVSQIFVNILKKDINAYIILSNAYPYSKTHLECINNSIRTIGGNDALINRIKWIGPLNKFNYMNLVNICKVHLEPYKFGGLNTTMDAISLNIPVICLRREDVDIGLNFTSGIYNYIDWYSEHIGGAIGRIGICDDCIAGNTEEYVDKCCEIASNVNYRNKIMRKLAASSKYVFRNTDEIGDYEQILNGLTKIPFST